MQHSWRCPAHRAPASCFNGRITHAQAHTKDPFYRRRIPGRRYPVDILYTKAPEVGKGMAVVTDNKLATRSSSI